VVLVAGTGLMTRSLGNALATELGFDAERVLTVGLTPPADAFADPGALDAGYQGVLEAVRDVPGVEAASAVSHLPMNHETAPVRLATLEGQDVPLEQRPVAYTSRAGPGYFEAMGIPLLAGRGFRSAGADQAEGSIVVTRRLAERMWPDGSALGRLLTWGTGDVSATGTVVGVVEDVRWDDLAGSPRPHLYRPLEGSGTRRRFLVARSGGAASPAELAEGVRRALAGAAPELPAELRPMTDIVRESTGVWAIGSAFFAVFGAVALALAALGIYGVVSFSVARRRPEIGLRIALGAHPAAIGRAVLREGLRVTMMGLAVGLGLSVAAAAAAARLLFGVGPLDPVVLGGAALLFTLVSVLASLVPVRRAVRVDPVEALRSG
jgi:putative ABC transport system permease protein